MYDTVYLFYLWELFWFLNKFFISTDIIELISQRVSLAQASFVRMTVFETALKFHANVAEWESLCVTVRMEIWSGSE